MSSNDGYFGIGLVGIVAIFGSVVLELAQAATPAPHDVIKLERVVVVGKRVHAVAQLPRIVVEGRRTVQANDMQVAAVRTPSKAI